METIQLKLSSNSELTFQAATQNTDGKRHFSGIANSGKPFGLGVFQSIVDFDGIQIKPKTAVLLEHSPHKACGVATLSVDKLSGSLKAEGVLMSNEHGNYIADLADNGFPWEMSIFVEAARYEELSAGAKTTVNGNEITGPMQIMRDCRVREVSFTPVGVDNQTQAIVLSQSNQSNPTHQQEKTKMTIEELQTQIANLEKQIADLKDENTKLKQSEQKAKVDKKLSAAGVDLYAISAPMMTVLLSASEHDLDVMIADLGAKQLSGSLNKPSLPASLTMGLDTATAPNPNSGGQTAQLSAAQATNSQGKSYV